MSSKHIYGFHQVDYAKSIIDTFVYDDHGLAQYSPKTLTLFDLRAPFGDFAAQFDNLALAMADALRSKDDQVYAAVNSARRRATQFQSFVDVEDKNSKF